MEEAAAAFVSARFEKALRTFSKVLEYNSGNAAAWTGQVKSLIELGEFSEAKLWADKALEKFASEPELLAAKAVALGRMGDLRAALAFSDASIEERGDTAYIWLARGDVLLARAERRSEYCFEKALSLAPADWAARWLASRICFFYRKFSVAMKYAQEALNLNPGMASVWLQAGTCQAALGLVSLAENSFVQAKQLDPECSDADAGLRDMAQGGFWSKLRGVWNRLWH